MSVVPTIESKGYVLHFFPDKIVLTDERSEKDIIKFWITKEQRKEISLFLGCKLG